MNNYTSVTFTWEGEQQPGLWCPALSSNVIPMERSGEGWSFTAELPNASGVSWAIVPNVTEVTALSPALLDAALSTPNPTVPSLYRLIGTDPMTRAEPNISVLQQPDAPEYDWADLGNPAPQLAGEKLATGHKIHYALENPNQVLFLDGEVMQRIHNDFLDLNIAPIYVHNSGMAQRMGDFADPIGFAHAVGAHIEEQPDVIVGMSAGALAACALAVELGAQRVVLLSPAVVAGIDVARELMSSLLANNISVDIAVGSEENRGDRPEQSIFTIAQGLADGIESAGGRSTFTVFPGGHDLAAWRPVLARMLS